MELDLWGCRGLGKWFTFHIGSQWGRVGRGNVSLSASKAMFVKRKDKKVIGTMNVLYVFLPFFCAYVLMCVHRCVKG